MFYSKNLAKKTQSRTITDKKSDGAPMILFIDVLENAKFPYPILPVPSRIDKILNGRSSNLLFPSHIPTIDAQKKTYSFDFVLLYQKMLHNLLHYAYQHHRKTSFRPFSQKKLRKWWDSLQSTRAQIPTYQEDLYEILQCYLRAYRSFKEGKSELSALITYCDQVIAYIDAQIQNNQITVQYKTHIVKKDLYTRKNGLIYPTICEYDIVKSQSEKVGRKACVPLMIYDDLLDCFLYNKQILQLKQNPALTMNDLGIESSEGLKDLVEDAKKINVIPFSRLEDLGILKSIETPIHNGSEHPPSPRHSMFETILRELSIDKILNDIRY